MFSMASKVVCIICGKEKPGIPVKEDWVLRAIRWFKTNVTRDAKENTLVVCKEDWTTYKKARKKFTTRRAIYIALGVLFVILGNIVSLSVATFLLTVGVLLLFYFLSLFNYTPDVEIRTAEGKGKAATRR